MGRGRREERRREMSDKKSCLVSIPCSKFSAPGQKKNFQHCSVIPLGHTPQAWAKVVRSVGRLIYAPHVGKGLKGAAHLLQGKEQGAPGLQPLWGQGQHSEWGQCNWETSTQIPVTG